MKPRKVVVTLEIETDVPIKELKTYYYEDYWSRITVNQVQVNVIKEEKK
jgi:hypothetical protein